MNNNKSKFELLARAGYGARGIVYFLIGGLALLSAFGGQSGDAGATDSKDALATLLEQPFGRLMLGVIGLGLVGHTLWRFAQALLNADHVDADLKGYVTRAGHFVSGITHIGLAVFALQLALRSSGSGSQTGGEDSWTAWLMQQPFGRYLVGAVGLAVIGAGIVQAYRGITAKYKKRVHLPPAHAGLLEKICGFGLCARGAIFIVIGGFLLYAALTVQPEQAGSIEEALGWIRGLPFGALLYALVALGLVAFGVYSVIEALYRRIESPARIDTALKAAVRRV